MRVQVFNPEPAVERFDESSVGRLARSAEVERNASLVSPQIQIPRYKLGPLIDAYLRRQSDFAGHLLQDGDDVSSPKRKPRLQRWGETRECIDDRQYAQLRWQVGRARNP